MVWLFFGFMILPPQNGSESKKICYTNTQRQISPAGLRGEAEKATRCRRVAAKTQERAFLPSLAFRSSRMLCRSAFIITVISKKFKFSQLKRGLGKPSFFSASGCPRRDSNPHLTLRQSAILSLELRMHVPLPRSPRRTCTGFRTVQGEE